ncbi:hypothetical protein [Panacagrimonas perspica]|uniref:hypothetical protein n=1 Tax=Panacagrimonas perspica TaxID=381431 RepID=UPI001B37DDC7|nr:hypothetical protein [Panacagrimonas perspica]
MRNIAPYLLLLLCTVGAAAPTPDVVPGLIDPPDPPYTVEALRAWHGALGRWRLHYPAEQEVMLRESGPAQLLICSGGGMRNGDFVLFQSLGNSWRPIGEVSQSHHPVRVLPETHDGWHDFETFSPLWGSGGNEVYVAHYRWTGSSYEMHSDSEGKFCDYEQFKTSAEFAQSCR